MAGCRRQSRGVYWHKQAAFYSPIAGLPTIAPNPASLAPIPLFEGPVPHGLTTWPHAEALPLVSVFPGSILSTTVRSDGELPTHIPGWATVPPKLLKKIWNLEYVDMWELLPESWRLEQQAEGCCRAQRPRRGLVTNLALWTECYAMLVAVLASRFPEKTPHFMAYLRTITRASRNFEGAAWASYDMAYRRQAANQHSLDWATIDTALYNEAFTGRARAIPRCRFCLADSHESRDCSFAPEERLSTTRPTPQPPFRGRMGADTVEVCQLFNKPGGSQCRYKQCRFAHICSKCHRGSHPASDCELPHRVPRARSRSPAGGKKPLA